MKSALGQVFLGLFPRRFSNLLTTLMAVALLLGNPNKALGTYLHGHFFPPFKKSSPVKTKSRATRLGNPVIYLRPVAFRPCLTTGLAYLYF